MPPTVITRKDRAATASAPIANQRPRPPKKPPPASRVSSVVSGMLAPRARAPQPIALGAVAEMHRERVSQQHDRAQRIGRDHEIPTPDDHAAHRTPPVAGTASPTTALGSERGGASSRSRRSAATRARSEMSPLIRNST